jgi:hypothetical protein
MQMARQVLRRLQLPEGDAHALPSSEKRFPDGAHYRVEIPSVEGPRAMEAVLEAADQYHAPVHRISQGSGIMLLTDKEIREMVRLGRQANVEVSLFVGPRAAWDIGGQVTATGGRVVSPRVRGADQLVYAIEDVRRATDMGIRSVLVADEGLLWVLGEMRQEAELPRELIIKVSVLMGAANPASIKLVERLGADTYNIPTDLTLAQIAAIRQATSIPLDIYVEAPDDLGGFVRHYEIPEIIRVSAPVYIKFGLRNAPNVYPSGTHLEPTVVALSIERVRRASIGLEMIQRYAPALTASPVGAARPGIPVAPAIPSPSGA